MQPNVSFSLTPSPTDILQKITASLAAKTAPEFSGLVEAEIMELGVRGFLEPVDPIVNEIGREDFKPNSLYVIKGNTYNMPYAGGGYGQIWYRTDLFEKEGIQPPKTWDEWKAAAQKLTKDGVYGFATAGLQGRCADRRDEPADLERRRDLLRREAERRHRRTSRRRRSSRRSSSTRR